MTEDNFQDIRAVRKRRLELRTVPLRDIVVDLRDKVESVKGKEVSFMLRSIRSMMPTTHVCTWRGARRAVRWRSTRPSGLLRSPLRPPLCKPLLELLGRLYLNLLLRFAALTRRGVARRDPPILLLLIESLNDSVPVLFEDILGNALHSEDFDIEALPVRQCIFDLR